MPGKTLPDDSYELLKEQTLNKHLYLCPKMLCKATTGVQSLLNCECIQLSNNV